jgi:hypothetical protein
MFTRNAHGTAISRTTKCYLGFIAAKVRARTSIRWMEQLSVCSTMKRSSLNTPQHYPVRCPARHARSLAKACPCLARSLPLQLHPRLPRNAEWWPAEAAANAHVLRVFDSVFLQSPSPSPRDHSAAVSHRFRSTLYLCCSSTADTATATRRLTDGRGVCGKRAISHTPCSRSRPNSSSEAAASYLTVVLADKLDWVRDGAEGVDEAKRR